MPAPKLLDKKLVNASLATERKQEIDKGVKIAKAVDALRETRAKEEQDLDEWRKNTLKVLQVEIDAKKAERDLIVEQNRLRKEERIRLEAPIDLTQAWKDVNTLKVNNEEISDNLLSREIDVSARENDFQDSLNSLKIREREVEKNESATSENLRQAEAEREEAAEVNNTAQTTLSRIEVREVEQNKLFRAEEESLSQREAIVSQREEENEKERITITNEKILLADRRATLDRGFAELRRKQT